MGIRGRGLYTHLNKLVSYPNLIYYTADSPPPTSCVDLELCLPALMHQRQLLLPLACVLLLWECITLIAIIKRIQCI